MGLIDNPAFISAGGNVDTRTGFIFTSDAESPKILSFSCQGDIIVMSTYQGEEVEVTYSNLDHEELSIQADANTPILIVGNVTEISGIDSLLTIDLRSTRTLLELELSAADLESINLAGCRQMTKLNLSGCSGLQQLDLSQNIRLESLNLSGCSGLQQLDVTMLSELQSLDVSDCTALSYLDLTINKKLTALNTDGTQLSSPGNTLLLASLLGGGTPEGVAMEATSQEILQKVGTITAIEPDLLAGKKELALQISRKGVASSANDTLMQMASEVHSISQNPISFEGSAEYEKQMFGNITSTTTAYQQEGPLWNLYKVMTDLLNDERFIEYGGILLAEYYKGYDTIELMNAGAGGAYFTSDMQFYTEDKTGENAHVWNDVNDGMTNRWVAYLFAAPSTNYNILSTNLCPRSIHIGRHVGTISCAVAGRISEIVVTDGNMLDGTNLAGTQMFGKNVIIRNIEKHESGFILNNSNNTASIIFNARYIRSRFWNGTNNSLNSIILMNVEEWSQTPFYSTTFFSYLNNLSGVSLYDLYINPEFNASGILFGNYTGSVMPYICIRGVKSIDTVFCGYTNNGNEVPYKKIILNDAEFITRMNLAETIPPSQRFSNVESIIAPKTKKINLGSVNGGCPKMADVEVGELEYNCNFSSWNPTTILATPEGVATINANIRDHIAARVSDRTGLDALTFAVSTNLYNNLEQVTIDAFAAKNWNVAGA